MRVTSVVFVGLLRPGEKIHESKLTVEKFRLNYYLWAQLRLSNGRRSLSVVQQIMDKKKRSLTEEKCFHGLT